MYKFRVKWKCCSHKIFNKIYIFESALCLCATLQIRAALEISVALEISAALEVKMFVNERQSTNNINIYINFAIISVRIIFDIRYYYE